MSEREQIIQDLLKGLALVLDASQRLLALDAPVVVHLPTSVRVETHAIDQR